MSTAEESQRTSIEEQLRVVDQQLRAEMVARGFDPEQDDNTALTAPLAKLYMQRERLREELESLADKENLADYSGTEAF
ncbi:MAG TPA: hypothetical protein DCK93_19580 [Blastocatellia bacterium]|jgi:hypothetical protein|nr:hypothetical protein [Blastocatellia bacterium]HAF25074.1 hypothetical protein [Blastocatellia bacterium]